MSGKSRVRTKGRTGSEQVVLRASHGGKIRKARMQLLQLGYTKMTDEHLADHAAKCHLSIQLVFGCILHFK